MDETIVLTDKQRVWCDEYIIDFNATQAALRAGYSPDSIKQIGTENLSKPLLQQRIAKIMQDRSKRTEITQDRVLLEIARLAFSDPRTAFDENDNLLPIHKWPDSTAASIKSIKITEVKTKDDEPETYLKEIQFWDKVKSMELAAKHLGMLTDRIKVDHTADFTKISMITLDGFEPEDQAT